MFCGWGLSYVGYTLTLHDQNGIWFLSFQECIGEIPRWTSRFLSKATYNNNNNEDVWGRGLAPAYENSCIVTMWPKKIWLKMHWFACFGGVSFTSYNVIGSLVKIWSEYCWSKYASVHIGKVDPWKLNLKCVSKRWRAPLRSTDEGLLDPSMPTLSILSISLTIPFNEKGKSQN